MKKGHIKRLAIQEQTKRLIFDKGYTAVTMTDVAVQTGISVGGLYHHYHSVESIVLDIFEATSGEVWELVESKVGFEDCLNSLKSYFKLEKQDLLHFGSSINNILYQYYFSFPTTEREKKMKARYQTILVKLENIFSSLLMKDDVHAISNHIYIVLHGLTALSMTGLITEAMIDKEFEELIEMITISYEKANPIKREKEK